MANFQLSNIQPVELKLPEIKSADLSGFTAGFDKLAKIKTDAEANRIKRNKETAQKLLVTQVADPEFRARLAKGLGWGPIIEANPDKGMTMLEGFLKQDREDARAKDKMANKKPALPSWLGNVIMKGSPTAIKLAIDTARSAGMEIDADLVDAHINKRVDEEAKKGNVNWMEAPGGLGQLAIVGDKAIKFSPQRQAPKGTPEQQLIDARARGDEATANLILKVKEDVAKANRDPNSTHLFEVAYDANGMPFMKAISKAGLINKAGGQAAPETPTAPGAVQIPNANLEPGMTPLEPPPGAPSTGMAAPLTPDVAPATASNSVQLGFDQLGVKPAAPAKADKEAYSMADRIDDVRKTLDQGKMPSLKALSKITDAQTNNTIMQEMDADYQKAIQANEPGAKNLYKMFGNIRGISSMFTFMRNLDDSVVRPTEQKMIQEALPWAADSNRLGRAFDDMRKWWNNEDSQLGADAVAVMNTLSRNTLAFARARATDDVTEYIKMNVERGMDPKALMDIATAKITDAGMQRELRKLIPQIAAGGAPAQAATASPTAAPFADATPSEMADLLRIRRQQRAASGTANIGGQP